MKTQPLSYNLRRAVSGLLVAGLAAVVIGPLAQLAQAEGTATLSGRVYNADTGSGYAGATVALCNAGSAVTNASGNWQVSMPAGTPYCVRLASGAPAGLNGPITRNNAEVGTVTSYENQVAGTNCYHNASCPADQQNWDRVVDGGLDFGYTSQPLPAPVTPATPAATPTTTTPTSTPTAATTPGGAPADFKAELAASDGKGISLSWQAADPAVVKAYKLERSVDNVAWDALGDAITDASYQDENVAVGVHYYYRLSAISPAGVASDYALADVSTGDVLATENQRELSYTSPDKLAQVTLPAGTLPEGSSCTMSISDRSVNPDANHAVLAGPYELLCKSIGGDILTDFKHPVKWQFKLADKIAGHNSPQAKSRAGSDSPKSLAGAYDAKTKILTASAPGDQQVLVLASVTSYAWVNYVVVGGLGILGLALLAIIPFRTRKKMNYQEYLRAKYYNL